ncbi:MAG: glycoside hydrolase family 43 protein [Bacteroidota bacterium]|nr:glycoside hydrolase family 43 protein [Bacteroidota bacterium]
MKLPVILCGLCLLAICTFAQTNSSSAGKKALTSGNPIADGWYADPESRVFGKEYWIYPTYSAAYNKQTYFDAFSSRDLIHWTKHPHVLDTANIKWAKRAVWAPSPIYANGKYYMFFAANDIQNDQQIGGMGVAVASRPEGPFRDALGKPLIGKFYNKAQPIDPHVFIDDDGQAYLFYGGWGHCNVARLDKNLTGFVPFEDGTLFREITPEKYVEGPCMLKRNGKYYFTWAEGGWTGPDYSVAYAISDTPTGPFKRIDKILKQDPKVATGSGHHSFIHIPKTDEWYIVYHRRPLGETDQNHRVLCIDTLGFSADGKINPVKQTFEGVGKRVIR